MLRTKSITLRLFVAAVCCAGFAQASPAQGGWRQWEVRLHDGRRLEANPLGAPDDGHLSLSVGGYDRRENRIARSQVEVVAARPLPGESLPAAPALALCEDAIILRDGTTTIGRISLARVRWSEGVVTQRANTIDLRDVAYLVFAARSSARANCRREAPPPPPPPDLLYPCLTYPVGIRQSPRSGADE